MVESPSRDSVERLSWTSLLLSVSSWVDDSSDCFWFLSFFFFRRAARSFENPLDPALAESASPACDLGLSEVESIEERPLLREELPIVSRSTGVVLVRFTLLMLGTSVSGTGGGSGIGLASMLDERIEERGVVRGEQAKTGMKVNGQLT